MNRRIGALLAALAITASGCKIGENLKASWFDCSRQCVDCSIKNADGTCAGGVTSNTSRVCSGDYGSAEQLCTAACDASEQSGVVGVRHSHSTPASRRGGGPSTVRARSCRSAPARPAICSRLAPPPTAIGSPSSATVVSAALSSRAASASWTACGY